MKGLKNADHTGNRAARWMRWTARGISSLVGAFFLLFVLGEVIWGRTPWSLEGAVLAGLVIVAVLGALIAWRWEGVGGTVLVIGAIALGIFACVTARFNKIGAMLIMGGPFLAAGILFLLSWRRSKGPRTPQNSA